MLDAVQPRHLVAVVEIFAARPQPTLELWKTNEIRDSNGLNFNWLPLVGVRVRSPYLKNLPPSTRYEQAGP